jgi:uncharacterized short protein YbdD (DUF466 family)
MTLREIIHRIIGAPDYKSYVAHLRAHHPGETPLSQEEFIRTRLDDRYNRPGSRCC